MLSVPSVAMIEGRLSTRMSIGVEDPGREPDADERKGAGSSAHHNVSNVIV